MKLSALKIDSAAVEQGQWVADLPGLGELRLKVRGVNNADWRRLNDKLQAAVPLDKKIGGVVSPEKRDEIATELLLQACLLDWSGIEQEDGSPLAFSTDAARKFLTDADYRVLRDAVMIAASRVGEQAAADLDADVKN